MTKRIYILRSNPVKPDSRVEKEAACLAEAGYKVSILAWDRESNHKAEKGEIDCFGYKIPIVWFGKHAAFGAGMKSLKAFVGFQKCLFNWLRCHRKEYDIIHACDFDTAFTARLIQKLYHKILIFDVFDFLYGEPKNKLQSYIRFLQNRIINSADATIICTEERTIQIRDSRPKRLAVIHNTPPKVNIEPRFDDNDDRIKICYVGILQDFRLLEEIPEFFIKHSEFELHIGGFGKFEQFYKDLSAKYKNIVFHGRLPYQKTLQLEASCDIMLAIYDPSIENHRFAAPNKFYESLMLAKPVVMVRGTGMSQVVETEDIGVLIDYSLRGFENGIFELASRKIEWLAMQRRMANIYDSQYCWSEMKQRLLRLYSEF